MDLQRTNRIFPAVDVAGENWRRVFIESDQAHLVSPQPPKQGTPMGWGARRGRKQERNKQNQQTRPLLRKAAVLLSLFLANRDELRGSRLQLQDVFEMKSFRPCRPCMRMLPTVALVAFWPVVSHADTMRLTMTDLSNATSVSTSGDSLSGPLVLPTSGFGGYAFTGNPTGLQAGSEFTLTNINVTCQMNSCDVLQFDYRNLNAPTFAFPNAQLHLHADGSATTSQPGDQRLSAYVFTGNSHGSVNSVSLAVSLAGSGPFSADEWRDPNPYDVGPATAVALQLVLSGFRFGDTLSMPGSLGADVAVVSTPEPDSWLLLLIPAASLLLLRRRMKKA
ncbi:MAG: hypothetical protein NTW28_34620 [Candidatus Solibacter sp.]|nr:hypothetical protein [Candidatus Solibacter sp.]